MSALFRDVIVAVLAQESEVLQRWLRAGAVSNLPFPTQASAGVQAVADRIMEELREIGGITLTATHDRVLAERGAQAAMGCDAAHDDALIHAELTQAAICYAETAQAQVCQPTPAPPGFKHRDWPFHMADFYADRDVTENLVKAAAYLIAEAERLTRLRERQEHGKQATEKAPAPGTGQAKTAAQEQAQAQAQGQPHPPPAAARGNERPPPTPSPAAQHASSAPASGSSKPPPAQTPISPYVKIEPGTQDLAPLIHIYLPHRDDLKPAG